MSDREQQFNRRDALRALSALGLLGAYTPLALFAGKRVIKKKIPATGERLPVIGMGTSRTFDTDDRALKAQLAKVLQAFFDRGGALIDSSPMYGEAEDVLGQLLPKIKNKKSLFSATKVWTWGKQEGIDQMELSAQLWGIKRFDLMQIHNLRDWQVHIKTLKAWKAAGKVRYIGITTSHGRFHTELEQALKKERFDFVQLTYNIGNREVEKRLLPVAQDRGVAVLVNRPFMRGQLFRQTRGKPLPAWAQEFDCRSWAQFFLKFTVSHPAVTCAIPATSKIKHMVDNMGANYGRLPTAKQRKQMIRYLESI